MNIVRRHEVTCGRVPQKAARIADSRCCRSWEWQEGKCHVACATIELTLKNLCCISAYAICDYTATTSRALFLRQEILPLVNWLINNKKYLPIKGSMAPTCFCYILTDRRDLHHYQLTKNENLRILCNQRHTVNYLFVLELSKHGIVYLTIYVTHHHSLALWNK